MEAVVVNVRACCTAALLLRTSTTYNNQLLATTTIWLCRLRSSSVSSRLSKEFMNAYEPVDGRKMSRKV